MSGEQSTFLERFVDRFLDPGGLVMWTIYHGASDMPPGVWRVRRSLVRFTIAHDPDCVDYPSLEAAREPLAARGLYCAPRMPDDEPQIVETWF